MAEQMGAIVSDTTLETARHAADVSPRTEPQIQAAPRHRTNRLLDRLGARAFTLDDAYEILHVPEAIRRMGR